MAVFLEQLLRELSLSWRRIRTSPGPALFAIVTLALGIGITVATYSVVYSALWRPMGIADESRVAFLGKSTSSLPGPVRISLADYQGLLREQKGFADAVAWAPFGGPLAGLKTAELVDGEVVSGNYFSMLGLTPFAGRLLEPGDDAPDAKAVVVLSHHTWRQQFGSAPGVVGATVKIADRPFEIVGIAPPGFRGVHATAFIQMAAWVPMAHARVLGAGAAGVFNPAYGGLTVALRLGPSQTWESAATDAKAAGERLDASVPRPPTAVPNGPSQPSNRYWTTAFLTDDQQINIRDALGRLIVGLPALVLLIACTNIANLVLSRGVARRHDFGVRRALGATRWRLIREQLVEQTIVTIAGGAAGVFIAYGLVALAGSVAREQLVPFLRGAQLDWSLDGGVVTSTAVAVLLSIVVSGLVPALHLTRDSLRTVLDSGGTAATPKWRGRANLVAVQVGLSVGLFLIALVFVRMILDDRILKQSPFVVTAGSDRVAVAAVPFRVQQRDSARSMATVAAVLDEVRRAPGVMAAAASSEQPYARGLGVSNVMTAWLRLPDRALDRITAPSAIPAAVTPEFFAALDRPLRAGRTFQSSDAADSRPVAIINEGLALDLFGVADATGRDVVLGIQDRLAGQDAPIVERTATIIGILPGATLAGNRLRQHLAELYVPLTQQAVRDVAILVRAPESRRAPVEALRAAIKTMDPELAVAFVAPANVLEGGPVTFVGYIITVLLTLAFAALGMAMAGLYGVLSHVMTRRTREMGIRIAIGASSRRILTMVFKDGFRPMLEGLFIGLATATVVRVFLKTTLSAKEIAPLDPVACVLAAALILVAGSLACYLPARRAANVDPNVALRNL